MLAASNNQMAALHLLQAGEDTCLAQAATNNKATNNKVCCDRGCGGCVWIVSGPVPSGCYMRIEHHQRHRMPLTAHKQHGSDTASTCGQSIAS
jgi:hypothetical protein